jgi:hypothetical protein
MSTTEGSAVSDGDRIGAGDIAGAHGEVVGVRFTDPSRGATFDGRYAPGLG